ncbi:MAG: hypothetical protein Q8L47_03825 [bacterium]|nr:hypothetical protein [bacterium]
MKKIMKNKKVYSYFLVINLVAVLAIAGIIRAYSGETPKVVVEGDYIEAQQPEPQVGAFIADPSGLIDVNITNDLVVDELATFNKATFTSTTTPSKNTYYSVSGTVAFSATTSAKTTETGIYNIENTGAALLCDPVVLDLKTAMGAFGTTFSVGTTTDSGDLSLTNTSTATLLKVRVATTTAIITSPWDDFNFSILGDPNRATTTPGTWYEGTRNATGTPWVWDNGVDFVVSSDVGGATSTDSWTNGVSAFSGVANIRFNCKIR